MRRWRVRRAWCWADRPRREVRRPLCSGVMADWVTISSLATAGGTLVLAVATFASVRSANRSTKLAEVSLREQLRPVLVHSRLDDPEQKIMFSGGHWVRVPGSAAVVQHVDGVVYLALSM